MGRGVWQRHAGLTPGSISVHIPSIGTPPRHAGPWPAGFRRALAAAAGVLALPGAAAAAHLDGFVFRFPAAPHPQEWTLAGAPINRIASSTWSGPYLGNFSEETVRLQGLDYLDIRALPPGRAYLSFDLLLTGNWGGNGELPGTGGADFESFFNVVANGQTLVDATFSTYDDQSYPGSFPESSHPYGTGSVYDNATEGFLGRYVYHFDTSFQLTPFFPHCCTDVDITFSASFGAGYDLYDFEKGTWGLDNVVVSSTPIPEPATSWLVGLGPFLLGARRSRADRRIGRSREKSLSRGPYPPVA